MSSSHCIKPCDFPGCQKPRTSNGLCEGHRKQKREGKPLAPLKFKRPKGTDPVIRFKEVPCRRDDLEGPCHEFIGAKAARTYGGVRANGQNLLVHRYLWIKAFGPIPEGLEIDHRCMNRRCINLKHLRIVTQRINKIENSNTVGARNFVKTQCPKGHPFSPENTYINGNGARCCRICRRRYAREHDARNRKVAKDQGVDASQTGEGQREPGRSDTGS